MAAMPKRGDVWLVDLGMAAKVRPCLVISVPADEEHDRVLATLVPRTISARGSRFEVETHLPFLKAGAFDAQNLVTVPTAKLVRRLGTLPGDQMAADEEAVGRWLGFKALSP